jgi:hypothetical protein
MASELAAALAKFQAALPPIIRGTEGQAGTRRYKYAELDEVVAIVLPALGKLGLSFTTFPHLRDDGKFVLVYSLMHSGGEERIGEWPLGTGTPQQLGGAVTYGRRYCLMAVTGVCPAGEDDDGKATGQRGGNGRASAWGADAEYERSVTGPPEGTPEQHARTQRTRGPIPADQDRWDGQPAGPPLTQPEDQAGGIDGKQQARMFALFAEVGMAGQDGAQRDWLAGALGRPVPSRKDLTFAQAQTACKYLAKMAVDMAVPGSADAQQVGAIATLYASKLGYKRTETPQMLAASEQIIGRSLAWADGERTHQNLSAAEARKLHDTLDGFPDRAGLEDWLRSPAEATP